MTANLCCHNVYWMVKNNPTVLCDGKLNVSHSRSLYNFDLTAVRGPATSKQVKLNLNDAMMNLTRGTMRVFNNAEKQALFHANDFERVEQCFKTSTVPRERF